MNTPEPIDALEAPPEGYEPSMRVQIALEARLRACPACGAPQLSIESRRFTKEGEGEGGTVRVRFFCEAAATAMVMPSGAVRAYGFEPCREFMRRHVERIAAEAAVFAGPHPSDRSIRL